MIHKTYDLNPGRDFIVSDLHGCIDLLKEKMEEVLFDPNKDRIFSVGDLIDRGRASMECLRLLSLPYFHSVRGNHEEFLIDVILHEDDCSLWCANGGSWFMEEDYQELRKYALLAKKLPYAITVKTNRGDIGICHAEPKDSNWGNFEQSTRIDKTNMIWGRTLIRDVHGYKIDNVIETYHGHTVVARPAKRGNVNFIDTGAVFTGNLTFQQIN